MGSFPKTGIDSINLKYKPVFMEKKQNKHAFLFKNLLRGFIWLLIIIGVFIFFKTSVHIDYDRILAPVYNYPEWVIVVFFLSEIMIGLIPPELFMIWALQNESAREYIIIILILSVLSYSAGIIGFLFGRYLNKTRLYRFLSRKFLHRSEQKLKQYGIYIILVASLTPLPYSGISMLIGAIKYPGRKFMLYSTARFLRFGLYAYLIWQANMVS